MSIDNGVFIGPEDEKRNLSSRDNDESSDLKKDEVSHPEKSYEELLQELESSLNKYIAVNPVPEDMWARSDLKDLKFFLHQETGKSGDIVNSWMPNSKWGAELRNKFFEPDLTHTSLFKQVNMIPTDTTGYFNTKYSNGLSIFLESPISVNRSGLAELSAPLQMLVRLSKEKIKEYTRPDFRLDQQFRKP